MHRLTGEAVFVQSPDRMEACARSFVTRNLAMGDKAPLQALSY